MFVRKIVVLVAMLLVVAGQVQAAAALPKPPTYLVGAASRSINPDADGTFAGQPVYLGGYGIGGGSPVFQGRPATGILGEGLSVHAFAVSDGRTPFVIADIEAQGWFVALKNGPWGLLDMRKEVERRTGGALPAESVVIQSDHSHSGPDPLGVWGGVPDEYLQYVSRPHGRGDRRRLLLDGAGAALLRHRAGTRPALQPVRLRRGEQGSRLRRARAAGARAEEQEAAVTLLNFSAHTTVLGSSNTKASRRLGPGREPVAGAALRRQGRDRGRDARAHAARPTARVPTRPLSPRRRRTSARSTITRRAWSIARPRRRRTRSRSPAWPRSPHARIWSRTCRRTH